MRLRSSPKGTEAMTSERAEMMTTAGVGLHSDYSTPHSKRVNPFGINPENITELVGSVQVTRSLEQIEK